MQSPAHQAVAPIEVGARSKYANMQQTDPTSGHCLASHGNDGGAQIGEIGSAQVARAQEESPGLPGLVGKAGERIRTVDIHVGNVTLYH